MELILPFQNYPYSQQSPKIATKKKFCQGLLWRVSIFQLRQTQMQEDTTTSPKFSPSLDQGQLPQHSFWQLLPQEQ